MTRPNPSEIHVYCATALPHRQNFPLRYRELPATLQQSGEVVGSLYAVSGIGPQPEPAATGRGLRGPQRLGAGGIAWTAADLRIARRQQIRLDPPFRAIPRHVSLNEEASIAVAGCFR